LGCPKEVQLAMTAKSNTSGMIWFFGSIYTLALLFQLCQGDEDLHSRHTRSLNFYKRYSTPYHIDDDTWWWLNKRAPGSEFLGKRAPGSEFLGKRRPGSEFLGKRVPGSEFLGKRAPGSEFLGKRVPGSEFLGKRVPGSEFLGKRVPGSEFLGKRRPGSEFLGKRVPGSEFLGKRSLANQNDVMENILANQKRSAEVPLLSSQHTNRGRFEGQKTVNYRR